MIENIQETRNTKSLLGSLTFGHNHVTIHNVSEVIELTGNPSVIEDIIDVYATKKNLSYLIIGVYEGEIINKSNYKY